MHKAKELAQDGFKGEVERHLTGNEGEPWEVIYFKLYKSQLPVVEKALEIAGLMLGTDSERDGWRCQECGSMEGLKVHYIKPRS